MEKSKLPGLNLLLIGPTGTGKTTAIKTWLDAGVTPFCIFTEPSFEVLGKNLCKTSLGVPVIHWHYIPPMSPSWADMLDSAKKINTFDLRTLSGLSDINKTKYQQFLDLIVLHNNFICQGCGEAFGDVSTWGTDRVVVNDSLSGINIMAMNLVVGSKPVRSMSDWGIAMQNEELFVQKICVDKRCHMMLIGHTEREVDEVTGASTIMTAALGRKLAPRIPRFFSDVVLAKKEADKFYWSTTAFGVDLKARNLPLGDQLLPSVVPLLETWKSRGGVIEVPQKAVTEEVKTAISVA